MESGRPPEGPFLLVSFRRIQLKVKSLSRNCSSSICRLSVLIDQDGHRNVDIELNLGLAGYVVKRNETLVFRVIRRIVQSGCV